MNISGMFLKSKVARRIATLLLLAATIPALLITGLSHHKTNQLVQNYEHEALVHTSQNYALSVFTNLKFARAILQNFAGVLSSANWQSIASKKITIFRAISQVSNNGKLLNQFGASSNLNTSKLIKLSKTILTNIGDNKVYLMISEPNNENEDAAINLVLPSIKNGIIDTFLVAEINPNYLWGDKADYPSNISACTYRITENKKTKLFCSSIEPNTADTNKIDMNNHSSWELFLRAEFNEDPWNFEATRLYTKSTNDFLSFINNDSFISVTTLSLLTVALLSLIQIRKTMVPLEQLIDGTKNIAKGNFLPVAINDKSEFSDLANAFNKMASDIKRQFETLRSLSTIDQEITSKLNIDQLTDRIINRILQLKPDVMVSIFQIIDASTDEIQCIVNISDGGKISTSRKILSSQEINLIKFYEHGHFNDSDPHSQYMHHQVMITLGANQHWVFPILWQGEICAFICIGSKTQLNQKDHDWDEIKDIASRIGIVISAQQREQQLLMQAQYDALTGLPNRILLQDRLNQALEHSERTRDPVWVVFLDLDRFKFVNDSLGHQVGDELLIKMSKRLQAEVRDTDTVARFGGDEFIIILYGDMDENLRMGIVNRLVDCIAIPIRINNQELNITCSLGISVYPNDGTSAGDLIKYADIAMYRAKELGKNNFQFFTKAMNEKVAKRVHMENLLRKALNQNELSVYYQPKLDLNSMQIVGMEALIRWNNTELGFVSPLQFIALAEETGLIVGIGEWVMRTACEQAAKWTSAGFGNILMSVNVSARQFKQNNLISTIQTILDETGLPAQQLELELTESMIMNEVDVSSALLAKIKSLGVQLSIDDFGTGYSNLTYLKNLPIDTLKIDKTFIDDIVMHTDKAPIVDTIIALTKNLNLKVIAEGVETSEQVTYLKNHGCNQIQGYYFSKPECAELIEKKLIEANAEVNKKTNSFK